MSSRARTSHGPDDGLADRGESDHGDLATDLFAPIHDRALRLGERRRFHQDRVGDGTGERAPRVQVGDGIIPPPRRADLIEGIALDSATGTVWEHEHGPQGGDEVNVLVAGRNYGWPVITYGRNYGLGTAIGEGTQGPGMEQPNHYWVPSIAPSGMAFYTGDRFPDWTGDLFIGSLKFELLVRLRFENGLVAEEQRLLEGDWGRIRDVRQGPDGYLYLLIDSPEGKLLRLEPSD